MHNVKLNNKNNTRTMHNRHFLNLLNEGGGKRKNDTFHNTIIEYKNTNVGKS